MPNSEGRRPPISLNDECRFTGRFLPMIFIEGAAASLFQPRRRYLASSLTVSNG